MASYSTARQGDQPDGPDESFLVIAADLYLARACENGDAQGISIFRERYEDVLERVRRRFGARAPSADDLWSDLCQHIFVGTAERPPRISTYAGQSELGAWVRVVVSRILLNRLQAPTHEGPADDQVFETLLITHGDPEWILSRAERKETAMRAFGKALAQLDARDRRILKLAFADAFTIDDVAALYEVHRSTAARWIKDAAALLRTRVIAIVREDLHLTAAEYESWARGITSSIDLSVTRYLQDGENTPAP